MTLTGKCKLKHIDKVESDEDSDQMDITDIFKALTCAAQTPTSREQYKQQSSSIK